MGVGERVTAAVTALGVCHNVTPVYDTENIEEGGSLPESEQVKLCTWEEEETSWLE